jgi:hypothetical protein
MTKKNKTTKEGVVAGGSGPLTTNKIFLLFKVMGILAATFVVCSTVAFASMAGIGLQGRNYNVRVEDGRTGIMVSTTEIAIAAQGTTDNATTSYGVYGVAKSNLYVYSGGGTGDAIGIYGGAEAFSGDAYGVKGEAASAANSYQAIGVYGLYDNNIGTGTPNYAYGVKGYADDSSTGYGTGNQFGVYGAYYGSSGSGQGYGVYGEVGMATANSAGVYGKGGEFEGTISYAGYFEGNVGISGDLSFGLDHATTTACSVLGSIYFSEHARELCYCDGSTWRKVSATSSTCY